MERPSTGRERLVSRRAWMILLAGLAVLVGSQAWVRRTNREAARVARGHASAPMGSIVVSVPPLAWPVRGLVPMSQVMVINPPGSGCEQVELTPGQLRDVALASLAVTVGFGLDDGVRSALERGRGESATIVSLESVVRALGEPIESAHEHGDQAADDTHDHAAVDQHAWLDPIVMKGLISEVAAALSELPTTDPLEIVERAANLRDICDEIDAEYRARLGPIADKRIIVQHNAFSYLARRYGLTIEAVTRPRHDVEPTPGDLAQAARLLREKNVRVIFVDPPGADEATERIAEAAGARVLVLDPLGDGDWPALMRRNLDALVEGLTPPGSGGKPTP